jgi:hypothetical protein
MPPKAVKKNDGPAAASTRKHSSSAMAAKEPIQPSAPDARKISSREPAAEHPVKQAGNSEAVLGPDVSGSLLTGAQPRKPPVINSPQTTRPPPPPLSQTAADASSPWAASESIGEEELAQLLTEHNGQARSQCPLQFVLAV